MPDEDYLALLEPQGKTLRDPREIEQALGRLWAPAESVPGDPAPPTMATRICAGNLIVVGRDADWHNLIAVLGEISPRYPTRTIIALFGPTGTTEAGHTPDTSPSTQPTLTRACVSALCHVGQPHQPQVCCEQIVLRTTDDGSQGLARTILPILEPDLPTMVWWTHNPLRWPLLFKSLQHVADRLVLDAGPLGLAHLDPKGRAAVRELGWYRTQAWRELVAGLFDGSDQASAITELTIELGGHCARRRLDAMWLIAFVGGQLDWQPMAQPGDDTFVFSGPDGRDVRARIAADANHHACLHRLYLRAGEESFDVRHCPDCPAEYRVAVHRGDRCHLPRSIELRQPDRPRSVTAALTGRMRDPAYDRALPLLTWMADNAPG